MTSNKNTRPDVPGISELRWVPPDQLDDYPRNWRRHPPRQMKALQASIEANGSTGALLFNEVTNRLFDEHPRKRPVRPCKGVQSATM